MIHKQIGEWLIKRHFHAGLVAFACEMLSLLGLPTSIFAGVITAFITLRLGAKSGLAILAWVALPALAILALGHASVFDLLWLRCIIVWLLAVVLSNFRSWSSVLLVLTLIGIAITLAVHFLMPDPRAFWYKTMLDIISRLEGSAQPDMQNWRSFIDSFAKVGTGIVIFSSMIGIFLQLMLARYWQSSLFNPGGLRPEIMSMRITNLLSLVLPLAVIIAFTMNIAWLIDTLPVILFPFVVLGFICLHALAAQSKSAAIWLPAAYIVTCFVYYPIYLWALLGFIDSWFKIPARRKYLFNEKQGEI